MMRMASEFGGTPSIGMGSLLKGYREGRGMTQRELAAATGMSIGTLRDLEQGRTRLPRWGIVEELATVLGLGQVQRAELARVCGAGTAVRRHRRPAVRAAGLSVEVLGPLSAWRDGVPVALGSARQRAVLGMLALHADTGLHREAIIDVLWGERPPASAVPEVQGYVSRLRKMAGQGSAELISTVGGCRYHLRPGAGRLRLDLEAFWRLAREARSAARADPARACDGYEQALGLWRGDLLADVDLLRDHPAALEVARQRAEAVLGYAEVATRAAFPAGCCRSCGGCA